jgi:hypothetical protein
LPQPPVRRPLGEADLGHQLRSRPVRAAWDWLSVHEWGRVRLQIA